MTSAINFALAALQLFFIVPNPTGAILNWVALVFCFGMGIASAILGTRK